MNAPVEINEGTGMNMVAISINSRGLDAQAIVSLHLEIHDRIRDAAMTLWRMPGTAEERYLKSGARCSWPPYVRDWHAYGADNAKMPKIPPQPEAIDRMEEVLGWIAWLATQDSEEAIILWFSFGVRTRSKALARRLGIHRETVRRKRRKGVERLMVRYAGQI